MTDDRFARAADILASARAAGQRLAGLPDDCRPRDAAEAYRVQDLLHQRLMAQGRGPLGGHKIGCTTPVMQRFLNIASPCAGAIPALAIHQGFADLRFDAFRHVGVECEIAVRLGRDLTAADAPFTAESVASAVEACCAAIEVVDDRWTDYKTVDTPTLIADDFFNAACVLGQPVADWRSLDLPAVTGETRIGGQLVGQGRGADVMGHPFAALAWLAGSLVARGHALRAGQVVLTGSVVETRWVALGDDVVVSLSGLGEARVRFL